ncbi:unnamed protein product [Soboliphyme baturini]|uniref:Protein amnionless n=1 Tax=Soboliphyme baturini TaxID=241478 RepID=A0A183J6K7_9BILA|nr:unnamed protein product [Soboliphyme baturini]
MHNAALVVLICCLLCLGDGDCRTFTFKAAKPFRPGAAFSHPCDSAFVKLRSSSTAVLNVDQDWMFKDVVLPQDVEIIFTDSVTVREIPLETMACDGNSVRYREQVINPVLQNWHDPKSWIVSGSRSFALHADLIPGSYDTAVFLKNETYYKQTIQSFLSHVSSKEGSLQFNVSAAFALAHDVGFDDSEDSAQRIIEITSETCGDPSGCVNPNMEEATMNKICSNVKCMTDHSCTNAVKPKGHCCPVCAALMRFATGYGFVQKDMEKEVARKVSRSLKDGIEISLVKVSENFFYQLVIVPASKHFDKSHMLNAASIIKSKVLDEALGVFLLITGMALLSLVIVWKRSALLKYDLQAFRNKVSVSDVFSWIIRGRLQLRIIWRGNRGDDRIQLELNDPPDCSPTPSTSGFANPSFSQLMKYDAQKDNEEFLNEAASYYKIPFPASDKKHA